MTPSELFKQRKIELELKEDEAQTYVVSHYDALHAQLQQERLRSEARFFKLSKHKRENIKGLYVWGDVGRGKTLLMDIFYDAITAESEHNSTALRMHFHEFMHMVHDKLKQLGSQEDTLVKVARDIAQQYRILCLDEFHVNDIGDAMILGTLLEAMFKRRVLLITTSNRPPTDLYKDGLQRERFIPAIEQLSKFCELIELNHETDYRLLTLKNEKLYVQPINSQTKKHMKHMFQALTGMPKAKKDTLLVNGRPMRCKGHSDGVIWFNFSKVCTSNTSKSDYLELVENYHTVLLSNVPNMDDSLNDAAKRFLNLLDVLYDKKITVIISAKKEPHSLYTGKKLAFQFDRAVSRLLEMQSHEYLSHAKKATTL